MPRRNEPTLTAAQLQIMELFWKQGELGVAAVWKLLAQRRPLARNTVQTMLVRLEQKGWLHARQQGNAIFYRAARPRKSVAGGMLRDVLDRVFAGSASGLVMTLLQNRRLSRDEATRIRAMIDRAAKDRP